MQEVFVLVEGDVSNLNVILTGQSPTLGICTLTCLKSIFCDGYTYDKADGTCKHLEGACSLASVALIGVYFKESKLSQNYCEN